jgi:hypothetical protein
MTSDPWNNYIPKSFNFQTTQDKIILMMPLLKEFCIPQFDTIGEVVECFQAGIRGPKAFLTNVNRVVLPLPLSRVCNSYTSTVLPIGEFYTYCLIRSILQLTRLRDWDIMKDATPLYPKPCHLTGPLRLRTSVSC